MDLTFFQNLPDHLAICRSRNHREVIRNNINVCRFDYRELTHVLHSVNKVQVSWIFVPYLSARNSALHVT